MKTPKELHIELMTGVSIEQWESNNAALAKIVGKDPLKLNENDSNLVWAAKHWWSKDAAKAGAKDNFEQFWFAISAVYERVYEYKPNLAGIYSFVSEVWWKTIGRQDNFKYLFEEFERDSMPSNAGKCSGQKYSGRLWDTSATYNDRQLMAARITVMMSQMSCHLTINDITLSPRWTDLEIKNIALDFLL